MTAIRKLGTVDAEPAPQIDVYDLGHDDTRHLIAKHDPKNNVVALTEQSYPYGAKQLTHNITIRTDQEAANVIAFLRMAFPLREEEGTG